MPNLGVGCLKLQQYQSLRRGSLVVMSIMSRAIVDPNSSSRRANCGDMLICGVYSPSKEEWRDMDISRVPSFPSPSGLSQSR